MKLIIIRGPSGSGKSTIAQALGGTPQSNWFEADQYFYKNGIYQFNPRLLGEAHQWCQNGVRLSLRAYINAKCGGLQTDVDAVVVSNTSTTLTEANTYIKIAQEEGVSWEVIRTPGPWNIDDLFSRNEHNVPRAVLEKQVVRYVPVDGEREWDDLSIFNAK